MMSECDVPANVDHILCFMRTQKQINALNIYSVFAATNEQMEPQSRLTGMPDMLMPGSAIYYISSIFAV